MEFYKTWESDLYKSTERCKVVSKDGTIEVNASVAGQFEENPFTVNYLITTNRNWQTLNFSIGFKIDKKIGNMAYFTDGKGNWYKEEGVAEEFKGCLDIDISLTPFTNSLPINRLKLEENESAIIPVIYINIFTGAGKKVFQKYTRLSDEKYHYENVPNDFEAVLIVDKDGFVTGYPELFKSV